MLEQALVDATALKEAALKSAQAAVLEAAQPKIEETIKALLEQDDPAADEEGLDDLLGGDADAMGMGGDMGAGEVGDIAGGLSMAVQDGEKMCACPDEEEEIEIDFGELERQMVADEGAPEMGQEDLAQGLDLSGAGDELGAEIGLHAEPGAMEDEEDIDLDEDVLSSLMEAEDEEIEEAKMTADMMALASRDAHRDYKKQQQTQKPAKPAPRHKSLGQDFDLDTGDDSSLELAREGKMIVTKEKLIFFFRKL